jgi:hypothetical protein
MAAWDTRVPDLILSSCLNAIGGGVHCANDQSFWRLCQPRGERSQNSVLDFTQPKRPNFVSNAGMEGHTFAWMQRLGRYK